MNVNWIIENVIQIKSEKCRCECKNRKEHYVCKKDYIWNPAICNCKNGKYSGSIIDNLVITYDETIKVTKTNPTKTTL